MRKLLTLSLAVILTVGLSTSYAAGDNDLFKSYKSNLNLFKKTPKPGDDKIKATAAMFGEGAISITAGYGFPNFTNLIAKAAVESVDVAGLTASGIGPLHFRADFGLSETISVGVSVNYSKTSIDYTETDAVTSIPYDYSLEWSGISALARMNVHFGTTEKIDPYWGFGVGWRGRTIQTVSNDPNFVEEGTSEVLVPVGFETTVGFRYYIIENLGFYLEMGIAKSLINGGLAFAF